MRREAHIPLFLWIATAVVVHGLGGGGATTVVQQLEETFDIQTFAKQVRRQASYAGRPVEVTLINEDDDSVDLLEPETKPEVPPDQAKPEEALVEQGKEPEEQKVAEKKPPEAKKEAKKEPAKPDLTPPASPPIQPPVVLDNRRVAVEQDVEDKNQEDNESAAFAGEYANRVQEQTRASMTASDGSGSRAEMGGPTAGVGPEVGNSQRDKFAQSEVSEGRKETAPGEMSPAAAAARNSSPPAQGASAQQAQAAALASKAVSAPPPQSGQKEQQAQAEQDEQLAAPETYATEGGSYAVAKARREQAKLKAMLDQQARAGRESSQSRSMMGLGAAGKTPNGVNLNLNFQSARAVIGSDHLAQVRQKDGERRLSEHRGKWQSLGLDRWKPALENYVANVKPGNQTALNTARVPFARYLNEIHQRLHEVFADRFLGHLDQLPQDHPLNNQNMSTHLEIALSREDGRVVRMGITKSSGVTAFDVGALDAVQRAAPYGPPPGAILSSDGNVYLHWEFHRRPEYACSTYFARPFIIDLGQQPAPPRIDPTPAPPSEKGQAPPAEKKSGTRDRDETARKRSNG